MVLMVLVLEVCYIVYGGYYGIRKIGIVIV